MTKPSSAPGIKQRASALRFHLTHAARFAAAALALAVMIPAATMTTGCFTDRRQAMEVKRTEAFDLFTQGQELERRGDLVRAIEYYSRAAEISPRPAFYARAGRAHAQLGQHVQAIHYYDLALKLNPVFESARAERDLSQLALAREAETAAPLVIALPATELSRADVLTDPITEAPAIAEAIPPVVAEEPIFEAPPAEIAASTVIEAEQPELVEPTAPEAPALAPPAETAAPAAPSAVAAPTTPAATPATPPAATGLLPLPAPIVVEGPLTPEVLGEPVEVVSPGSLPPRRVRAAGEALDRESLRAALFSHVSTNAGDGLDEEWDAAMAAWRAQRWDEATRRWERVVSSRSSDVEARLKLGDSLQRSGRSVRAWDVYASAATLAPQNPTVFREWGNSLVRAGELDLAAERYETVVRLDPDLVEVRNNLAAIDLERGRALKALRDLRTLVSERSDFAPAWLNLAIALERTQGDVTAQLAALETYLRLDGSRDAEVERWIVELRSSRR